MHWASRWLQVALNMLNRRRRNTPELWRSRAIRGRVGSGAYSEKSGRLLKAFFSALDQPSEIVR
jgi:hypothetical protein